MLYVSLRPTLKAVIQVFTENVGFSRKKLPFENFSLVGGKIILGTRV